MLVRLVRHCFARTYNDRDGVVDSRRSGSQTTFATSYLSPERSLRIEFGRRNNRPYATGSLFVCGAFSADETQLGSYFIKYVLTSGNLYGKQCREGHGRHKR